MPIVVYKLGGSLLDFPLLAPRLQTLLEQPLRVDDHSCNALTGIKQVVIVGGGEAAQGVRRWDHVHRLGDERAHDLAIDAMSFNARFVASLLPRSSFVATRDEAELAWGEGRVAILNAAPFLRAEEERSRDLLPRLWTVTSDSLAAYVALHWPADLLVLVKSVARPSERILNDDGCVQPVDPFFLTLARKLARIDWANLRADQPVIERWL